MVLWITAVLASALLQSPNLQAFETPLADAIKAFNARSAEDPIGKRQPSLTEDEVLASIRWWAFRRDTAPVTDAQFAEFQRIVETRKMPAGSAFEVLRGYQPTNEMEFTVWSIRIRMPHGLGTFAYVIRERMISWRTIGPEERKVMETWNRSGIPSFQRIKHLEELRDARNRDEAARIRKP